MAVLPKTTIVLAGQLPDEHEVLVAYFFKTLTSTEHNCMQIDKKGLAIVKAVLNFHDYLYCQLTKDTFCGAAEP